MSVVAWTYADVVGRVDEAGWANSVAADGSDYG